MQVLEHNVRVVWIVVYIQDNCTKKELGKWYLQNNINALSMQSSFSSQPADVVIGSICRRFGKN